MISAVERELLETTICRWWANATSEDILASNCARSYLVGAVSIYPSGDVSEELAFLYDVLTEVEA